MCNNKVGKCKNSSIANRLKNYAASRVMICNDSITLNFVNMSKYGGADVFNVCDFGHFPEIYIAGIFLGDYNVDKLYYCITSLFRFYQGYFQYSTGICEILCFNVSNVRNSN